jgi:hypothetical protein
LRKLSEAHIVGDHDHIQIAFSSLLKSKHRCYIVITMSHHERFFCYQENHYTIKKVDELTPRRIIAFLRQSEIRIFGDSAFFMIHHN